MAGRKGRVPPQLRAWVYRRHRKRRSYDPAPPRSMALGYGKVRSKPYQVGRRGGVAWSGGRRLRYDPSVRTYLSRAKTKAKGFLGKIENNLTWIGLGLGLLIPAEACRAKHGSNLYSHYIAGTLNETQRLFGADPNYKVPPAEHLMWKFGISGFGKCTWGVAFWCSIAAQIISRLGIIGFVSQRANTAVKKLSMGTLMASIIGALFMRGGDKAETPTTPASTPAAASSLVHYG